jgi:AbrB family looped-hinge helix DNA binding protein
MKTRIDRNGRVVIPKSIRDRLGLGPGTEFDVDHQDGTIELHRRGPKVIVAEKNGRAVLTTTEPVPPMTDDELFRLIDESREWPRHY